MQLLEFKKFEFLDLTKKKINGEKDFDGSPRKLPTVNANNKKSRNKRLN